MKQFMKDLWFHMKDIFSIMKPLIKLYFAFLIIFLVFVLTACQSEFPVGYSIQSICEHVCEKRITFNCIEEKLVPACVPTCIRSTNRGLFDPTCAAFAGNRHKMTECNVECL